MSEGRMEIISYEYTKARKDFGHHPSFTDSAPTTESIRPKDDKEAKAWSSQWVSRIVTTTELDCIPVQAQNEVNTERYITQSKGGSHTEGAWPLDVKVNDFADRQRLLRRIKNEASYANALGVLTKNSLSAIQQNNSIDVYEDYFDTAPLHAPGSSGGDDEAGPPSSKTVCVFRDPNAGSQRAATKISWHPEGLGKVAVSYAILQFQSMPDNMPMQSYIWDINNPNQPDAEIAPSSPLTCLNYNPRTSDGIVGGKYNGLIGFWDLRKGAQPVAVSTVEKSHHDPVYDVCWIQSRSGNECCSVSTDGQMLWWDVRKLAAGPIDQMNLVGPDGVKYGGTCLEYSSDAGPTRYLIGTEEGSVLYVDRKAKKDSESQKAVKSVFGARNGRHHGPVYSVSRNPANPKYFLSVGDWTTKTWVEELRGPIMGTRYDSAYLTAGVFSPQRPGVFFTSKVDGTLDVWDFFHKQGDPCFSVKVGDQPLTSLAPQPGLGSKMLGLGASDGTVTILELGRSLTTPQHGEKNTIQATLEREFKREKNLEMRAMQKKKTPVKSAPTINTSSPEKGGGAGGAGDVPATPSSAGGQGFDLPTPTTPQQGPQSVSAKELSALSAVEESPVEDEEETPAMRELQAKVEAEFFAVLNKDSAGGPAAGEGEEEEVADE